MSGDNTPSVSDGTDLGTTPVGTPVTHTFTILNTGTADLTLGGVTVPVGFTVTRAPISPVTAGSSTSFDVQCNQDVAVTVSASVSIASNDSNENPYTFRIVCHAVNAPEIDVQGNGVSIASGRPNPNAPDNSVNPPGTNPNAPVNPDNPPGTNPNTPVNPDNPSGTNPNAPDNSVNGGNPSATDGTDFGTTVVGTPIIQTFTILNLGTGDLTLGAITVPAGFSLTGVPSTPVTSGSSTTFAVQCNATSAGTYSGIVSIPNNDSNENPYTFAIACQVTGVPEMNVIGNSNTIASGDTTPSVSDGTDFETTSVGTPVGHSFYISNVGSADLTVGAVTVPAGFSLTQVPATPVTAGRAAGFAVQCDAASGGTFSGIVSIVNNDRNENPYTFAVTCQVTGNVAGNECDREQQHNRQRR